MQDKVQIYKDHAVHLLAASPELKGQTKKLAEEVIDLASEVEKRDYMLEWITNVLSVNLDCFDCYVRRCKYEYGVPRNLEACKRALYNKAEEAYNEHTQ